MIFGGGVIGKNVGNSAGSILYNGIQNSINQDGNGNFTLGINNGAYPAEYGDWAFNCVMIWDTALTDAEMVLLNSMINTYKSTGESLKQYFNDDCIMENREYGTNSSRELLLLKSNNINSSFGTSGPMYFTFGPMSRCVSLNHALAKAN